MRATLPLLVATDFPPIRRLGLQTLQVNLGYRCNQSCLHCHVAAGPNRTEMMDSEHADLVLQVLRARQMGMLDLTGGAPELSPHFRRLVVGARAMGVRVIDRCNLTILSEPGQDDLGAFLAEHSVEVTASLPCYSPANVDRQRGDGVFDRSIAGLQQLNALGYGDPANGRVLNLVYNPQGASLPPPQGALQADYKRELMQHFGIRFNRLFALTNMPVQRFGSTLVSKGTFASYMQLLKAAYDADNLQTLMCRTTVSVDWQGDLYDCDFNQMLGLRARRGKSPRPHLRDLLQHDLEGEAIRTADHCYGCTAGQGSSCGGALETTATESTTSAGDCGVEDVNRGPARSPERPRQLDTGSSLGQTPVLATPVCNTPLYLQRQLPMNPTRRETLAAAVSTLAAAVPLGSGLVSSLLVPSAQAQTKATPLKFGVGMFQPDREKNDATYRPLAQHLSQRLGRPVELRTVDTWEGLAKSLANGETDIALMGPWGYVLANHFAGAQVVSTILYQGKPEYFALLITHPGSGLNSVQDLIGPKGKGRTFAFGDKGSTSGYLIPLHYFMQQGIDPEKHFGKVVHTRHQAIQTQVTAGHIDAGADYNRNRSAMIEQGLITAERSKVIWQSAPLPNDAVAVRSGLHQDRAFVQRLQAALAEVGPLLATQPTLLPTQYTGFVNAENGFYKPIRDAGLATGKLAAK